MNSLDNHLHDAAQRWTRTSATAFVDSADGIVRRMQHTRRMDTGIYALLAMALLAGILLNLVGTYIPPENGAAVPTITHIQHAPTPNPEMTVPPPAPDARIRKPSPMHVPSGDSMSVAIDVDGFDREYERVLSMAIKHEPTQPLQAINEYTSLARLCERRMRWAYAVTIWQRAYHTALSVGDASLAERIHAQLERAEHQAQK